jgi:transposase
MFDCIVALDWAKSNMAVAKLKKEVKEPKVFEMESDIEYLKRYLDELPGTVQLVFEVSSSARKLFFELYDYADDIIVCNPLKNELIMKGPKNDRIDAVKLALLARRGDLQNVFLDLGENFKLRRLVSGYVDVVKALVRCKNHRADLKENKIESQYDEFVMKLKEIETKKLSEIKAQYEDKFSELEKSNPEIKRMTSIPGIGAISAVKIVATVASAERFSSYKDYWGYCGLARYLIESGGRLYGTRKTRHNPMMKAIYKMAALVAISTTKEFGGYYEYLTRTKLLPAYDARNAIARHIAKVSLMMLKHKSKYKARLVEQKIKALSSI